MVRWADGQAGRQWAYGQVGIDWRAMCGKQKAAGNRQRKGAFEGRAPADATPAPLPSAQWPTTGACCEDGSPAAHCSLLTIYFGGTEPEA